MLLKERPMNWNEYFITVARAVALKSKDPSTKVGAVIVGSDNKIISTGYNGMLPGFPDTEDNWARPRKYDLVVHAELNAVLYSNAKLDNSALYCTLQPCKDCMKVIIASGIKEIYYAEDREDTVADELANHYNIKRIKV